MSIQLLYILVFILFVLEFRRPQRRYGLGFTAIRIKCGPRANLPQLKTGEPAWCLDTEELYIGGKDGNVRIFAKDERPHAHRDPCLDI